MKNRELYLALMNYEKVDRMPIIHWAGWPETRRRWLQEGLPEKVNEAEYFGAAPLNYPIDINLDLFPAFEKETLEETEEYRIFRQADGVIAQHWKKRDCIPHFVDFTIKGTEGQGWSEYKKRLQPDKKRIPADFYERIEKAKNADAVVSVFTASMIGWIRNWVGVENLAYIAYDNRELLKEMSDTITDLVLWSLDEILPKVKIDTAWGWEDICFKNGPLLSPDIFKEVAVPNYKRIADRLRAHGVKLYLVDCDGVVDALLPHWLEAGVNTIFPLEIGTWNADSAEYKKRFGRELRIFGGINKNEFGKGKAAIDAELKRRLPVMKEGGFVPLPDHLLPPDVSLDNYRYYLEALRKIRI